jgi:HEAT repeat protein
VDGLGSKNWRVRWGSVQALGEILRRRPDDDLATRSLLLLPSADDPKLVRPLTEALVWCRDPRVPEAIAAVLQLAGRSPLLAGARLEPLGRIRYTLESSAVDEQLTGRLLDTMTSDAPPIIRGTTALVVGMLQPPGWEARLAALATDAGQVDAVRDYAIKALGLAQTTPGIELVVHAAEGRYGGAWPAVQTTLQAVTRPEALPGLATAAASSRWWVREAAAVSIGRIGTDEAMELLRELAADGDSDVRKATVSGLLLANRSDAVPLLCRLAADTDHSVRSRAVDVLWTQYPDLAVTPLIEVATEPAHPARAEAIDLLGRFDRPDAEAALLALAADPDRAIREAAERSGTAREVAGGHRGRAWLRHPLTALTHGVKDWLEWDGVRQMWDEERLAGTPGSLIGARLTSRISLDAELTRRFRHAMRAFSVAFVVVAVLLTALAMLLARACLWLSHVMVDHWVITSVVVALGVLTLVPGVRNLEDTGLGGWLVPVLQLAAMAVVVVAVVGVLTYTWWIWLGVLLAAGSAAALWAWRRNRRVGRRVRAVMAQLEQGPQVRADRATAGVLEPDAVLQPAERSQVQEADPV